MWLRTTHVDVHEDGSVPILLSNVQMCNLGMCINMRPDMVTFSCSAMSANDEPMTMSSTRHFEVDLTRLNGNVTIHYYTGMLTRPKSFTCSKKPFNLSTILPSSFSFHPILHFATFKLLGLFIRDLPNKHSWSIALLIAYQKSKA